MKMLLLPVVLTFLVSCGEPDPPKDAIQVQHVLIAWKDAVGFKGREMPAKAKDRNVGDAEKLATEILARAQAGEDFDALVRQYTDDSAPGTYWMYEGSGEAPKDYYKRSQMAKSFGDVGFSLKPGEVGMAPYHREKSPFGWHVIKRLK